MNLQNNSYLYKGVQADDYCTTGFSQKTLIFITLINFRFRCVSSHKAISEKSAKKTSLNHCREFLLLRKSSQKLVKPSSVKVFQSLDKIQNQENSSIVWLNMSRREIQALPRIQGSEPVAMTCPYCFKDIITQPQRACYETLLTQTGRRIFDLFGFWAWACCWIPGWNDKIHFCPSCQRPIGIYKNGR